VAVTVGDVLNNALNNALKKVEATHVGSTSR